MVTWRILCVFVTLFATFWRAQSGVSGLSGLGAGDELADAEAFGGLQLFLGGRDDFRRFSCMEFAPRSVSSIVRFWELIACRVGPVF